MHTKCPLVQQAVPCPVAPMWQVVVVCSLTERFSVCRFDYAKPTSIVHSVDCPCEKKRKNTFSLVFVFNVFSRIFENDESYSETHMVLMYISRTLKAGTLQRRHVTMCVNQFTVSFWIMLYCTFGIKSRRVIISVNLYKAFLIFSCLFYLWYLMYFFVRSVLLFLCVLVTYIPTQKLCCLWLRWENTSTKKNLHPRKRACRRIITKNALSCMYDAVSMSASEISPLRY